MWIENKHIGHSCQKESFFLHNRAKSSYCGTNKQKVKIQYMEMTDTQDEFSPLNN